MKRLKQSVAIGSIGAVAVAGSFLVFSNAGAAPAEQIDICHSTSSTKNPYNTQKVNANSADLNGHIGHTGPMYSEGMESGWGDIIPPVPGILPDGLNWPAGQATLNNGCTFVNPSPSPTETPTETPTEEPTETPTPTPTDSPTVPPPPGPAGTPAPETQVSPAAPETPAPVEDITPIEEIAPVEIADPGALPAEDDAVGVRPAAPQSGQTTSPARVPTQVPAGGGAAR